MDSQSKVQSTHNSSETTISSWDDLTDGKQLCLNWAHAQDWDLVKGYAKEHGPEVLLGVYSDKNSLFSVLSFASLYDDVEIVKLTLDAGFDNKVTMYLAADRSIQKSDNSTILGLLLEHGLDKRIII